MVFCFLAVVWELYSIRGLGCYVTRNETVIVPLNICISRNEFSVLSSLSFTKETIESEARNHIEIKRREKDLVSQTNLKICTMCLLRVNGWVNVSVQHFSISATKRLHWHSKSKSKRAIERENARRSIFFRCCSTIEHIISLHDSYYSFSVLRCPTILFSSFEQLIGLALSHLRSKSFCFLFYLSFFFI